MTPLNHHHHFIFRSEIRNVRKFRKFCWLKYLFDSPVSEHRCSNKMELNNILVSWKLIKMRFHLFEMRCHGPWTMKYKTHWRKTEVFISLFQVVLDGVLSPVFPIILCSIHASAKLQFIILLFFSLICFFFFVSFYVEKKTFALEKLIVPFTKKHSFSLRVIWEIEFPLRI